MLAFVWLIVGFLSLVQAAHNGTDANVTGPLTGSTKTFYFDVTYFKASPDGFNRTVVGLNNTWPCPNIHVDTGDRVLIYVHNSLSDQNTSLHVHGLFQHNSSQFDGPELINQCPIPPGETMLYNFTVPDQAGAYWYHSHTKGQYGDGYRGAFIIHDKEEETWDYDEQVVLTLSEWYHSLSLDLDKSFLNLYNPTGAEPIPDNLLFNDTFNGTWHVQPNTTYLLRIINLGAFVSQYLWIEDHEFTVVEIDGIKVQPNKTELLYITVAQRYTVLVTTKDSTDRNYAFTQAVDEDMLDTPGTFSHNVTNQMVYNSETDRAADYKLANYDGELDDFYLRPLTNDTIFDDYDYQITVNVTMDNLGNGVNYAFFNNITFVNPKVPTLMSAISAKNDSTNPIVYGSNTNTHVLQKDDVVELVLNNFDTGKHPFHLHGHTFQVVYRGPDYRDEAEPVPYDASNITDYPEYPMIRDTVYVRPQSSFVIRFKADNPGVWFFHCHIEWHLSQGLALTLVEAPDYITEELSEDSKKMCTLCGVNYTGNAAGNSEDFLNLKGENVQHKPLPDGFTAKGIVAMVFSVIAGLLGVGAIAVYGMSDIKDVEKKVAEDLDIDLDDDDEITEDSSSSTKENKAAVA